MISPLSSNLAAETACSNIMGEKEEKGNKGADLSARRGKGEEMHIQEAVKKSINKECAIRRKSWEEKEPYVVALEDWPHFMELIEFQGRTTVSLHWEPKPEDLMADDWELIEADVKENIPNFSEVMKTAGERYERGGLTGNEFRKIVGLRPNGIGDHRIIKMTL